MKKFFPLCLLLIVALVWTISIAGDEGLPTLSDQPDVAQKAPAVEKDKTVAKTEKVARVAPVYRDVNADMREEVVAKARALKSAGESIPASISPTHEKSAIPKTRAAKAAPVEEILDDDKIRWKQIKADGVISADERADYERLLSLAAPGVELPVPLNIVSESEVNDSCQIADPIACGDTVWCANLAYQTDDNDWYTFTLTNEQQVTIETHGPAAGVCDPPIVDTYLELWTGDCQTMLAVNDDINYPTNNYSRIIINLIAGTYAINSDATYWGGQTGSYHLSLLCEDPPVIWDCTDNPPDGKIAGGYETEPNDTCTTADDALCEYAYCGALSDSTDRDWYRVVIPAGGTSGLHVRVFANDTPNQYAQGGGLDPWVGLYASDCVTLVASNDDYNGTFPDAERFDSQLDPGGANCFFPGDTVYIEIMTPWSPLGGPYLLIINCEPCEIPTGACCVDTVCVGTNYEVECDALQGNWTMGFACDSMFTCAPPTCGPGVVVYSNGEALEDYGDPLSQCAADYSYSGGAADDITLSSDTYVTGVVTWTSHWNGPGYPAMYDGVNITFYHDDLVNPGQPAGEPTDTCDHILTSPGGIYHTEFVPIANIQYLRQSESCIDFWRLEIPLASTVTLQANTLYWLEIQPVMGFFTGGQIAIMLSQANTGAAAKQIVASLGLPNWTTIGGSSGVCQPDTGYRDLAFCLIGAGCDYVIGNVNGDAAYNGLDVTYGVNWFKAIGPAPVCPDCPPCNSWYYCGDVNGQCDYNGLDITYNVNWFKQVGPAPVPCDDCPQIGGPAGDNSRPETPSVIKTKTIFEQKPGTK